MMFKTGLDLATPSQKSPRLFRESLFSNEGDCLEFLLERLEHRSQIGLMSSADKNKLREDKNMYAKLTKSKPLLEIFKLMNNVEKMTSQKETSNKGNFDEQFDKLLYKLKDEYNALFKEKSKKLSGYF